MAAGDTSALRYLDATDVHGPAGALGHVAVRGGDDHKLGELDGVLIDPAERRVRFLVIESRGWLGATRYLLPADELARICDDGRSLSMDVASRDLAACPIFERGSVPSFSDDDLIDALFRRVA